jgi:C4-dicarboxylate-specific signal transduction histidine kinase
MKDPLIVMNSEGLVEFVNDTAKDLFSINTDFKDIGIRDILGDEIVDSIKNEEIKGNFQQKEIHFKAIDNVIYPLLLSRVSFLKGSDDEQEFIYSFVDLTLLKENEAVIEEQRIQLVQNTQLASLGEMASGIAHEINNPVTIMEGQIRRLRDYISDIEIEDEKKVELADKIQKNLHRVVEIISGIRKISRKGENDALTSFSLNEILKTLKNLCNEKLKTTNVVLDIAVINNDLDILVRETQIIQVLFNLVSNSFDAVSNLEDKWINVLVSNDKEFVDIRVVDSGAGIDSSTVQKMFNPFYTTKDVGQGTGIGLSISKKMVDELGGKLSYELFEGHTSFIIKLKKS